MIFDLKRKLFLVIVFFLLFNLFACENLNDPGMPKYNFSIFVNIQAGIDKQKFYIYHTIPLEEYQYGYLKEFDKYFEPNAVISLQTDSINYTNFFVESDSQNIRYYTSNNFIANAGREYQLKIQIGGELIEGRTVVPNEFEIISPQENQIISFVNKLDVNYSWTNSKNSNCYFIQVEYPFLYNGIQQNTTFIFDQNIQDTTFNFISYLEPVDTVYTSVTSFDINYFNHIFNGFESAGVEGAYGYFGSSLFKRNKFLVR